MPESLTMRVPASPSITRDRSASAPIAAGLPVAATNDTAAATFGPIEPALNASPWRLNASGSARPIKRACSVP
nr:hypothetical protein [Acidiphilium sp. 34-64-41]